MEEIRKKTDKNNYTVCRKCIKENYYTSGNKIINFFKNKIKAIKEKKRLKTTLLHLYN